MKSRYIKTKRNKLPKHPHSKRLEGSFEDSNRWIKCWHCGFIIDLDRLRLSDRGGIEVRTVNIPANNPVDSGDPKTVIITIDKLNTIGVLIDSNQVLNYYQHKVGYAVMGCPFCGCTNLP